LFLPLSDNVPLRRLRAPFVTYGLIALNIAVFLVISRLGSAAADKVSLGFGTIPSLISGENFLEPEIASVPAYATLVTSQFLHADWLHLLGNMLFLFTFGDNVEDAMGHLRYLAFYLLCGAAGALMFVMLDVHGVSPLIGASGAISGLVAAYLVLYPRVSIFGLVLNIIPLRIRALYVLGAWIATQVAYSFLQAGDNVAYSAHMGGAVAGALLVGLFKAREVPLFGRVTN
jgi:membrane associated rhomboid family serine protease